MSTGKDYLAAFRAEPGDKLDYGVKGMKWGVRKAPSKLKSEPDTRLPPRSHESPKGGGDGKGGTDLPPRSHEPPKGGGKNEIKSAPNTKGAGEPSAERYARLREQAKLGKTKEWNDDDLKWFNSRTEAMAKVNKLNESKPGWIKGVSKNVLQSTAQKVLSDIAQNAAMRYITIPINHEVTEAAAKTVGKKATEAARLAAAEAAKKK